MALGAVGAYGCSKTGEEELPAARGAAGAKGCPVDAAGLNWRGRYAGSSLASRRSAAQRLRFCFVGTW